MDTLYCWACGATYKQGAVQFCPRCGKPLPERRDLVDEIETLKNEPTQYLLLRILGGFLTILGLILLLGASVAAPIAYNAIYRLVGAMQPALFAGSADYAGTIAFWATVPMFVLVFLSGLGWIVLAEIIQVLVATFDQTKETSRLMRRLALMLSKED
jgi:hypothetical protein